MSHQGICTVYILISSYFIHCRHSKVSR